MQNITFSADKELIAAARERARNENTTLNEQFRHWLRSYARSEPVADEAMRVVAEIRAQVGTGGRRFTREEMNER